jgi:hypothetical protein
MDKTNKVIKQILRNYGISVPETGLTRNDLVKKHLMRDDMTAKGQGLIGNINGSNAINSPAITEYSIGVSVPDNYQHIPGLNPRLAPLQLDGQPKYFDVPSVVPGITADQIKQIQEGIVSPEVYALAEKTAADRQWMGKPVFAKSNEPVYQLPKREVRQ